MAAVSEACCTWPPVDRNHEPHGSVDKIGTLDCYRVGPQCETAIIVVYDIFGLHPNNKQVCDILSSRCGALVVAPDFLRGNTWPMEKMPPPDRNEFMQWVTSVSWDNQIGPDLEAVTGALKAEGVKKFGIVGFCWGAKMACHAGELPLYYASALVHYSFTSPDDVEKMACPVALMPSKDEPREGPIVEVLKKKPFWEKCIVRRFDEVGHGWMSTRGDWSDPVQAKAATEAMDLLVKFFKSNL